jgi:hypothetical protein
MPRGSPLHMRSPFSERFIADQKVRSVGLLLCVARRLHCSAQRFVTSGSRMAQSAPRVLLHKDRRPFPWPYPTCRVSRSTWEMTNPHCHLCGATLRRPEQFHELASPDRNDVIYLCRDETRCATRATFDPPTRRSADPHSTRPDRAKPEKKAAGGRLSEAAGGDRTRSGPRGG